MARIRTIKPEFFTSDDIVSMSPLARLFYVSLWCEADREGRLAWNVRTLKMRYLPGDDIEIESVAAELVERGLVVLYSHEGKTYAHIPTFAEHQVINNKERPSTLPDPMACEAIDAPFTRESGVQGERKGKEGKGTEGTEQLCAGVLPLTPAENLPVPIKPRSTAKPKEPAPTSQIWDAYRQAYAQRYGVDPVRNAKVNGQLAQLLQRLGAEEAVAVAAWFVWHNDRWYVSKMHAVDCLLRDCEKLRTEWATGKTMTQRQASEADRRQATGSMAQSLADKLRAQGKLA